MQNSTHIDSKLPGVGTSIFSVMTKLAQQHNAINLAQGFPDFDCPQELKERVCYYLNQGYNQYAPMPGVPALREQISRKTEACYGYRPDTDAEITVTSGATEALFAAIMATVSPGDEVVVLEPAYDSYVPAILLAGGKPVFVSLQPPHFRIDWELVKQKISSRTKLLILNSPHNPTGMVLQQQDLEKLKQLTQQHKFLILSDEVYEHIIFDGQEHLSMLRDPELRKRSFVISSFGKTYHTTGWKVGYCVAPPALTAELRKVHQFLTFSTTTPIQHALADYIPNQEHYQELPAFYQQKRDLFASLLEDSPFTCLPAAGTYFQLVSYEQVSQEKDVDFANRLTREAGVAAIPVSVFNYDGADHHILRFCFAKEAATLEAAAEKLRQWKPVF